MKILFIFFTAGLVLLLLAGSGCPAAAEQGEQIIPVVNYLLSPAPSPPVPPVPPVPQYPPDTSFSEIPTRLDVDYPAYQGAIIGPVFGNRITRLSDFPDVRVNFPYPKTPSWNSDSSLLMLTHLFIRGDSYEIIEENGWWSNDEKKWSAMDPHIYYAMQHNRDEDGDGVFDHLFVRRDVTPTLASGADPARELLIAFSGAVYENVFIGHYEGNIDHQDRYVVFSARKQGENYLTAIVYDILNRVVTAGQDLTDVRWVDDAGRQIFDWISVSPSGNHILMNWTEDPDNPNADFRGAIYQYDRDMRFIRKLADQGQHGDIGVDGTGRDVYVQFEFSSRRGIWAYDLDTGEERQLLPDKYGGGHVSCRNYQRPGWCYVSTTKEGFREVFSLKLDGSGTVNRFAQTRTTGGNSLGGVNPDGTKIIFASDWQGATTDDTYEAFVVEVEQ